jgi:hypothetical protein
MSCLNLRSRLALLLALALPACGAPLEDPSADEAMVTATTIDGCPGAWADADSYVGLFGRYRQGPPYAGDLSLLQILSAFPTDPVRTGGQALRVASGRSRVGRYEALVSNPAIGAAISFWDAGRSDPDLYFVIGLRRSAPANISALCLIGQGSGARPFALQRSLF